MQCLCYYYIEEITMGNHVTLTSAGEGIIYKSHPIANMQRWTFFCYISAKHSRNLGSNYVVATVNTVLNSQYIFIFLGSIFLLFHCE